MFTDAQEEEKKILELQEKARAESDVTVMEMHEEDEENHEGEDSLAD